MNAPARLLSIRVQGFKSFAERTHVSFGPGISAVVGPNGSGKSNLADALRWALGEQGRALRSRRSEDVIWAGSERRPALGMADVQLTLDNADRLLPVEYAVIELGRRLYRSGENDYLLNRQRVRLRDLVDLLDGAHLAENAFLFIGQGMVDQALALRPEERRPLFEEVARVRRHERRRRRAEEQLAESEANLARVEDILGELRPQARRLAAQAEQQASRRNAGDELAVALIAGAHVRWHAAAARVGSAAAASAAASAAHASMLAALIEREQVAGAIAVRMADRSAAIAGQRLTAEDARRGLAEIQLREARVGSEADAMERERQRTAAERLAVEASLREHRAHAAEEAAPRDHALVSELIDVDAALAEASATLARPRPGDGAREREDAAARRYRAAREAESERASRHLNELERELGAQTARAAAAAEAERGAASKLAAARSLLSAAFEAEAETRRDREKAQAELSLAEATARLAEERAGALGTTLAGRRGALAAAEEAIADLEAGSLAAAARRHGGRRVLGESEREVAVEPSLGRAVDAALAALAGAWIVPRDGVAHLVGEHGRVVVAEAIDGLNPGAGPLLEGGSVPARAPGAGQPSVGHAAERFIQRIAERGGGRLVDAVRRDDSRALRRLLAHTAWLPSAEACLELQSDLPPGWLLVSRDGVVVVDEVTVFTGWRDGPLARRAEAARLQGDITALEVDATVADGALQAAVEAVAAARAGLTAARQAEAAGAVARRRAEEAERTHGRTAEAAAREASWHEAQVARLGVAVGRARQALPAASLAALSPAHTAPTKTSTIEPATLDAAPIAAWAARERDLRERRDRLSRLVEDAEQARTDADRRRTAAEAAFAIATRRLEELETRSREFDDRAAELTGQRDHVREALGVASAADIEAGRALAELLSADAVERDELRGAETVVLEMRDGVRRLEVRAREVERDDLEARLGLENVREQLLVELAGLGRLGLEHLLRVRAIAAGGESPVSDRDADLDPIREPILDEGSGADLEPAALDAALLTASAFWAAVEPTADVPAPGRLATLRRRFHELGAGNPFAIEEYAEIRGRLERLELQHGDLSAAMQRTRILIGELEALIARQFRSTFEALERAFEARFRQLFGGGAASLSLTDPSDLTTTGIEIVARPPGKKAQALGMLSGGERALTAVALLFAMLEVRPVPFCVLDEVDSALDEANIGRFCAALRELADDTQCIVITHNRGTIESADALYGVTLNDDSVSRVISLRLEEATAIAARVQAGASGRDPVPVLDPAIG